MSRYGHIPRMTRDQQTQNNITIGTVVDTSDPHQMGRLRILCPAWGDSTTAQLTSLPWALYASPFAGANQIQSRGRTTGENDKTSGPVAYGMWNIPKVGTSVLVACIDGDPEVRFWFASLYPEMLPHTMPHGRYIDDSGPFSSSEQSIYPLSSNQTEAFTNDTVDVPAQQSFEWKTRAADRQVAAVNSSYIGRPNDCDISKTGDNDTQGYATSRIDPDLINDKTINKKNLDSHVYSWTTPGFHALSMDDDEKNCRIRFRTSGGNQIIMDDTNERVYISSAQGKTWIEIDEKGMIDIYGEQDVSIRSGADINLTADKSVRIAGKEGIHLISNGEIRAHAGGDVSLRTDASLRVRSKSTMYLQSDAAYNLKVSSSITIGSTNFHVTSSGAISNTGILVSSGNHFAPNFQSPVTGLNNHIHTQGSDSRGDSQVPTNTPQSDQGTSSATASPAVANELPSYFTSRIPGHEPWPRTYTDPAKADSDAAGGTGVLTLFSDIPGASEYSYSDTNVGKTLRGGTKLDRNANWRR